MDYHRVRYAQLPIRPMGSPDGLGAYFENRFTQAISPDPGGAHTVAAYKPLNGLGCDPCAAAAAAGVGAMPAFLSNTWVRVGLGLGMVAIGWYALGRGKTHAANGRRRHRRNHKIPLRKGGTARR